MPFAADAVVLLDGSAQCRPLQRHVSGPRCLSPLDHQLLTCGCGPIGDRIDRIVLAAGGRKARIAEIVRTVIGQMRNERAAGSPSTDIYIQRPRRGVGWNAQLEAISDTGDVKARSVPGTGWRRCAVVPRYRTLVVVVC